MQKHRLFTFMVSDEKKGADKISIKNKLKSIVKENPYLDCLPGLVPVPASLPRAPNYWRRSQCLSGRWRSKRMASGSDPASRSSRSRSTSLCLDSEI